MSRVVYPFIEKTTVAGNLRALIEASPFTAREIAERAEVHTSHLSRFLKTGVGISPDKIECIAQILGADVRVIYSSAA